MKKAVIVAGGIQHIVSEGDVLLIDHVSDSKKTLEYTPLLVIDGEKTHVGTPEVPKAKVAAQVVEPVVKGDKVTAIRYKAKKRVHKVRGHRQQYTQIKISKITV